MKKILLVAIMAMLTVASYAHKRVLNAVPVSNDTIYSTPTALSKLRVVTASLISPTTTTHSWMARLQLSIPTARRNGRASL